MADEPTAEPVPAETPQIPVNEALAPAPSEPAAEPPQVEASTANEPAEPVSEVVQEPAPAPAELAPNEVLSQPEAQAPASITSQTTSLPTHSPQAARELLMRARAKIQDKKRKKLEKIMELFAKHDTITNDKVEKHLHCSDATALRYLSILEKEGRIARVGTTGRSVTYTRV